MLSIAGMGFSHPKNSIDNRFLISLGIDTTEEWIMDKIGISTRNTVMSSDYIKGTRNLEPRLALESSTGTPTALGVEAAQMAIERAGIKAADIGMVIANSCFPHQTMPGEAQRIACELGIRGKAFDTLTACPAFALELDFLRNYREETLPDYVLCISTATLSQKVNYTDRTDGAIWGDGAAAWIVSPRHQGKLKLLDSFYTSDPSRCQAVVADRFGFFHQDGRAVRDFSVRQTVRLIKDIESRHQIDWKRDIFIGHQANATMLRQITNNREIPDTNHWHNASLMGNQAGAGCPIVLAQHWDEIKPGQKIVIAVVGAGLSWGSAVLEGC